MTLTKPEVITILKCLAKGRSVTWTSVAVQQPEKTVERIGEAYGWPDPNQLRNHIARLTAPPNLPDTE
jgi:hypothetical protein